MRNREEIKAELQKMSQEELINMIIEKEKVQAELDWYKEQFSLLKKARYSSSLSEKIPSTQLNLFNEVEDLHDHPVEETEVVTKQVKRKNRKKWIFQNFLRK